MKRRQIIFSLSSIFFAMVILSLTIGREILSGAKASLVSLAIINFSGYLFIFLMPVEGLVPIYTAAGYNWFIILAIVLLTAIVAQIINYSVGSLMSEQFIKGLIGEKNYRRSYKHISNHGGWMILLFNILPLASSVLSLIAGMIRYDMKKLLMYSFIGLAIKYLAMLFLLGALF
ncbi:hypothetical protein COY27_04940 [Candidatus Woesearchaeota archaeon CG_4_10_14_0_2_um_filter_33_13]|nr:MAG: hypothetical protein COY27_04940 [Candidatus Woesearchaeota archaeon CG_4_10_14_0_2_um_filter_33_13]